MGEQIRFLNMFSEYQPPEPLCGLLSQAALVAADIDPATRSVTVAIHSPKYIPERLLARASEDICRLYGLRSLQITAAHPADQLHLVEPEELMALFVSANSMTRGSLAGASWHWQDTILNIDLKANGKDTLMECVPQICQNLRQRFGVEVSIEINPGENLEGQALFEAMEKMRGDLISQMPKSAPTAKKEQSQQESSAIYGKPFKGKAIPMQELSLDMGGVIVEGRVFSVEHKELKKRNAWVINFDMTDNQGSVRINRFMENSEAKPILDAIKVGSVVRVQGRLLINQFDNEMVLKPNAIMPGFMPARQDTAEGDKRVELHLHTIMSNMDALTSTKAAIKQAAAWGHRAIAITDHGCVQSFTDALHVIEDWSGAPKVAGTDQDIKVLYGCEGYYINDVDDVVAVVGDRDMTFDEPYVAFDLETTGLNSRKDAIIEIGAVLMQNGKELDRFQTFVDPGAGECAPR